MVIVSDVIIEPTAWMRSTAARQVQRLWRMGYQPAPGSPVVVAPLGEWSFSGDHGTREERTCDRCRIYTPEGPLFYAGAFQSGPFMLVYGLCPACHRLEVGDDV